MHYTRGSISSEAEAIVNNTSLGTVTDAAINRILNKLYTKWEWGFLVTSTTVSFTSAVASAALPTDYVSHLHLKFRDTNQTPVYEHNIAWIDYSKYLLITQPTLTGTVPNVYTVSPTVSHGTAGASGNVLIYPTLQSAGTCRLIYHYLPTAITEGSTGDATAILFQNYNVLVEATVNELYRYMRDPRYQPRWLEATVEELRQNTMDSGIVSVPEMGLDPRRFKNHKARLGG